MVHGLLVAMAGGGSEPEKLKGCADQKLAGMVRGESSQSFSHAVQTPLHSHDVYHVMMQWAVPLHSLGGYHSVVSCAMMLCLMGCVPF